MKRVILSLAVALLVSGCVTSHDLRTQPERDRDAHLWTRAHSLRVAISRDEVKDCSSLGVVRERYYEGPPNDPVKRPMGAAWPEYVLRFKTAELGGDVALATTGIRKWSAQPLNELRELGEAYFCGQPVLTTASR